MIDRLLLAFSIWFGAGWLEGGVYASNFKALVRTRVPPKKNFFESPFFNSEAVSIIHCDRLSVRTREVRILGSNSNPKLPTGNNKKY